MGEIIIGIFQLHIPVRMCVNAPSTLVESKADVSINDKVFFSTKKEENILYKGKTVLETNAYTGKC